MNIEQFERDYPGLDSVVPSDFWTRAEPDHLLKICVERDRIDALDYMSDLIDQTPWKEMRTSYEGEIHRRNAFNAFLSEMWGYLAVDRWLCDDFSVADLPGTSGAPDFECEHIDVDATRLYESDEEYRIRRELEDLFEDQPYVGILIQKPAFDKQATTTERWAENEEQVSELLNQIENLDPENPTPVETDAFKIEFRQKSSGPFGFISRWERAEEIIPDEEGKLPRTLEEKADQSRGGRPLVVFVDCKLTSIDEVEEVVWSLIGEPHASTVTTNIPVSERVESARSEWSDYLREIGAIPSKKGVASSIRPEDEGVFIDDALDSIAGVMIRLKSNDVGYVPNIYTNEVDARGVYDRLEWGLDTRCLTPSDL